MADPMLPQPETPTPKTDSAGSQGSRYADLSEFRRVGNQVTFGRYEQDNDPSNGEEDIVWYVLAADGEKCLLVSKYGLDVRPYHTEFSDVTWENCSLRAWLNSDFLFSAFSEEERLAVILSAVSNDNDQGYPGLTTNGGNNTEDSVFLLSYGEAAAYHAQGRVAPTAFARRRGAYASDTEKTAEGEPSGWWWLRSPGEEQKKALAIDADESFCTGDVNSEDVCVVPAVWVSFDSGIFRDPDAPQEPVTLSSLGYDPQRFAAVGNVVTFGRYEQDNRADSKEEIEWIVLEVREDRCLLLSRKILDLQPYHTEEKNITWADSDVRKWLNRIFLRTAFSAGEQRLIPETEVDNGESQGFYKTDGGIDTKDWVFLLSYREATTGYLSDMTRRACEATPCVLAKAGAGNALWYRNIWLLRSPGDNEDRVVCMTETGQRIPEDVTFRGGVRPAIWLRFSGE